MKKLLFWLALFACPFWAMAQQSTCFDTTLSTTGRTQLKLPGSADGYMGNFGSVRLAYRTTGLPTGVNVDFEAGNWPAATVTPFAKVSNLTDTTSAEGTIAGGYRFYFVNVDILSGGTSPKIIVTTCPHSSAFSIASFATAPTISTFTAGSIIFAGTGGLLSQDNTNLFWDNTLKTLFSGPQTGYFPLAGAVLNGRAVNPSASAIGAQGLAEDTGTQTIWGMSAAVASRNTAGTRVAGYGIEAHQELNGVGGAVTDLDSFFASTSFQNGTATTSNGLRIQTPVKTGGTITTRNGILVESQTGGATNYAIQTQGGTVGLNGNISFQIALNNVHRGIWWNAESDCSVGCFYRDFTTGNILLTPQGNFVITQNKIQSPAYTTATNCADSAGAAACGAAAAGAVVIDAAATTVVVSTTAVTANSRIFIQEAPYLATEFSITCNTTTGRLYTVTALTAATSFTITASAAPTTNPACLNYWVVN